MTPAPGDAAPTSPDPQHAFATIGEPTRYRILELLATGPSTVGGVAETIGALQPQTTKHLQALEAAGLITIHKLGRRRVATLHRGAFAALAARLGEWARPDPEDETLAAYAQAIAGAEADPGRARTLSLQARIEAPVDAIWRAWTDPQLAARWWAPAHFTVRELAIASTADAPVRVALAEPGGAIHRSEGRVMEADPGRRLVFALAPVDEAGEALFDAVHTVELSPAEAGSGAREGAATTVALRIEATAARPDAAEAIAGLEPGWTQLLASLAAMFAG